MKKLSMATLVLFAVLVMLSGCASKEDFAVKVNGQSISRTVYENKLKAAKNYYAKQGINLDGEQSELIMAGIKAEVLDNLVTAALIEQAVKENNWDTTDQAVTEMVEEYKKQLPEQDYDAWLKEQDMSHEEVVNYCTFFVNVSKDVTVSEQEIQDFFDANYPYYGGQAEQVKARHILVSSEQEASDIIKELKAGADFAELAKEKSLDQGSKENGGDLGYFTKGQMVPEFEEAAFSQPKNQIPDKAVKTYYGYHVILVEDHKEAVKPDFGEVKAQVQKDALNYAKLQKVQAYFSDLLKKAEIDYAKDLAPEGAA
ncbi:MAG: peptidylprolyl isomerase [Peptococcaceae bacterium]|nr:peptidylprolyl isomerase [Peptococcaceae bacterium]